MNICGFPTHPAADLFPLMEGAELDALAADIKTNGLHNPIVIYWNAAGPSMMLDGRNRARACVLAFGKLPGMTSDGRAAMIDWEEDCGGKGSPTAWVLSQNLKRRHLDESQRAMVGARAKPLFEDEAKARMTTGAPSLNLGEGGKSADKAAALVNVSRASVENGAKVLRDGAPELVDAVDAGRVAVSTAAVLADAPKDEQREIVARGEKEILAAANKIRAAKTEVRRAERLEKIVEIAKNNRPTADVPDCPVLLVDPPWRYEHSESESRAIENQYPTMALHEIIALRPPATTPAVLFLWATSPKLEEAMQVLRQWGFEYRSCAVWVKDKIGMGYWFRQQHELLLVGSRGDMPPPPPEMRASSVIQADRGEHSAKPEEVHALIERAYPTLPKVEMFARKPRDGWHVWGNQAT